jgi:hypothetical protein
MTRRLSVTARIMPDGTPFEVQGRTAWALLELVAAGESGCTPIDHPGPRWSAYVFNLKREQGLAIQTITEAHRGPFAGTHARYVLRTPVAIISRSDRAEMAVAA